MGSPRRRLNNFGHHIGLTRCDLPRRSAAKAKTGRLTAKYGYVVCQRESLEKVFFFCRMGLRQGG